MNVTRLTPLAAALALAALASACADAPVAPAPRPAPAIAQPLPASPPVVPVPARPARVPLASMETYQYLRVDPEKTGVVNAADDGRYTVAMAELTGKDTSASRQR